MDNVIIFNSYDAINIQFIYKYWIYIIDYNKSRKSGDDKWKMFSGMMEDYDKRIHNIEERMNSIENK